MNRFFRVGPFRRVRVIALNLIDLERAATSFLDLGETFSGGAQSLLALVPPLVPTWSNMAPTDGGGRLIVGTELSNAFVVVVG